MLSKEMKFVLFKLQHLCYPVFSIWNFARFTSYLPKRSDFKDWKSQERKRKKKSLIEGEVIFGIHPVTEALRQDRRKLYHLYLKPNFETNEKLAEIERRGSSKGIPVLIRNLDDLDKLTSCDKFNNVRPHQGVCLHCSVMEMDQIYHYEDFLESFSLERSQWLYPVLIDIKDPMNLGGILRSAFFFGLNQVLVHGDRSLKRVTPVVSKASSGSAECMRIGFLHDFSQFLQGAREAGDIIIGTSVPEEEQDLRVSSGVKILDSNTGYPSEMEFVRESPTFLLFGSENGGLDAHLLDWCHCHVQIHSRNKEKITCVDSLNVSVAAGIVFHHLLS